MQNLSKNISRQAEKLRAVIELILRYHESGLRVLVGEVEPTAEELSAIIRSVSSLDEVPRRVATAFPTSPQERALMQAETIIDIVNDAGGWCGIAKMAAEFRKFYPRTWKIFNDHVLWVAGGSSRCEDESIVRKIASKYGVSVNTVEEKRLFVVKKIAIAALKKTKVLV